MAGPAPGWPPPPIDELDRTNKTLARDQHPKDHNDLQVAVNAVVKVLGEAPYGASETVTEELGRLENRVASIQLTPGPQGPVGPAGPIGATGPRRYYGEGPPGVLIGARPADEYVDTLTGDVYVLQ